MNRRDFVIYSTAAAAAIGVAANAGAELSKGATVQGVRDTRPYKAIFDARFQASCSFGAGAARLGCTIQPITGDVTALWFKELQPLWTQRKEAILGMTTGASLLCLEQLAWEQWMRVVARVEHRSEPDGTVRHRLFLRGNTLQEARAALAGNADWAERMVAPLVGRLGAAHCGRTAETVVLTRHLSGGDPGIPLVSWVIAARVSGGAPARAGRPYRTEVAPI
jgi:hypothetical protein